MIDIWEIDRLWRVYRTVEKDLVAVDSYVEPGQNNVYSVVFKKIILLSGALIEEAFKKLCAIIAPEERPGNIGEYKKIILSSIPAICSIKICVQSWNYQMVQPFSDWAEKDSKLSFWEVYNTIKHNPDNIKKSTFALLLI